MKVFYVSLVLCSLLYLASSQEIDLFTAFSSISVDGPDIVTTAEQRTTDAASIIGGTRILRATRTSSAADVLGLHCAVATSFISYSADVSVSGECRAIYAGEDGNGFTPTNFIQNGCDCWNLHILETDNDVVLEFIARSTLQSELLVSRLPIETDILDADVCFPYGGNRAAYASVDRIEIGIIGNAPNVDANIGYSCCQPSLSCWHTITNLNGDRVESALVGDAIKLGITCENYASIPETLEEFEVFFSFPQTIGRMDNTTINCTTEAINPTVSGNELRFNASLIEEEFVNCVVEVDLFAVGTANDVAADIKLSLSPDITFKSNANVNRQGTAEFCEPPVISTVTIGNLPTTLTPTTKSPTEEPSGLICISPRIIDGMCQCQTFPCFRTSDGSDIHCETDEWYCYFITMAPPSGSFRVTYRGHECFCTV